MKGNWINVALLFKLNREMFYLVIDGHANLVYPSAVGTFDAFDFQYLLRLTKVDPCCVRSTYVHVLYVSSHPSLPLVPDDLPAP